MDRLRYPGRAHVAHGPDTPNGQRAFRMSEKALAPAGGAMLPRSQPRFDLPRDSLRFRRTVRCRNSYEPVESPTNNIPAPESYSIILV